MNNIVVGVCLPLAALIVVASAVFAVRTGRGLREGAVTHRAALRRLKVIGGFGVFAGLTAAVPFAFAAGVESIWASIAWEVAGAIVVALLMMGLAASALTHADRATDLGKTDEESWHQRRRGVNPATGLPMVNRSIDAGGEPYGCGFSSSDDHRWDRD